MLKKVSKLDGFSANYREWIVASVADRNSKGQDPDAIRRKADALESMMYIYNQMSQEDRDKIPNMAENVGLVKKKDGK